MSFESNKLDKSYDMVSLCETAKHTNIAGMNMEIWSFSAYVFLTCFMCIYSRERVKICHRNTELGIKKSLRSVEKK